MGGEIIIKILAAVSSFKDRDFKTFSFFVIIIAVIQTGAKADREGA